MSLDGYTEKNSRIWGAPTPIGAPIGYSQVGRSEHEFADAGFIKLGGRKLDKSSIMRLFHCAAVNINPLTVPKVSAVSCMASIAAVDDGAPHKKQITIAQTGDCHIAIILQKDGVFAADILTHNNPMNTLYFSGENIIEKNNNRLPIADSSYKGQQKDPPDISAYEYDFSGCERAFCAVFTDGGYPNIDAKNLSERQVYGRAVQKTASLVQRWHNATPPVMRSVQSLVDYSMLQVQGAEFREADCTTIMIADLLELRENVSFGAIDGNREPQAGDFSLTLAEYLYQNS